jgi:hypothetical protein
LLLKAEWIQNIILELPFGNNYKKIIMGNNFKETREKIIRGLEQTRQKLLQEKAKNDKAIAISENGEVKVIFPSVYDK